MSRSGWRVIVRNSRKGEYFCGGHSWSSDAEAAFDFQNASRAAEFCKELTVVQIIVKFANGRPDLAIAAGKPTDEKTPQSPGDLPPEHRQAVPSNTPQARKRELQPGWSPSDFDRSSRSLRQPL